MEKRISANWQVYLGLFLVSLGTLMYEILLTRIFSVTMWYHYAFVAISVAMFGMTVGAVLVYLLPSYFSPNRVRDHLSLSALLFGLSIVLSFLTHLSIPFVIHRSLAGVYSIILTYAVVSIPFIFSGVFVCLSLTRFPGQVGSLYAADLVGAALGASLFVLVLKVTDGPTAAMAIACLPLVAAILLSLDRRAGGLRKLAGVLLIVLGGFSLFNTEMALEGKAPFLRIMWAKGHLAQRKGLLYDKWNSFSRIQIFGVPEVPITPFGFGLSSTYDLNRQLRQVFLMIDGAAGTVLTAYSGDPAEIEHLKYDVTNIVHYLRDDARVLVIGTGGGRDILSALAFDQKAVVGVEINEEIIQAVNGPFGSFTGHLDRDPRVTFVADEARSYIARQSDRFDIIQASLIDTWAATSTGAFVLMESSLYTLEAWKTFLERLTPRGILTFSRWYFREVPGEMYRLTSLASEALAERGVRKPRDHIMILKKMGSENQRDEPDGIGTILVSPTPFTERDVETIERIAERMQFDLVLTPRFSIDPVFAEITSGVDVQEYSNRFPIDISPPRDDRPFFFHMLRLRDAFDTALWNQGEMSFNMRAVFVLASLMLAVLVLSILFVVVPLWLTRGRVRFQGSLSLFIYFACIGLGFMLIEISQMQRLIIFLGHPTYALSVVLFTLLIACGLGSWLTEKVKPEANRNTPAVLLGLLLAVLVGFGLLTPYTIRFFAKSGTPMRILVAFFNLFPLGVFMGTAFPLGMRLALHKAKPLAPWLWGINGTTSVCASVLAVAIALSAGISSSFWTGFAAYALALLAYLSAAPARKIS